MQPKELPHADRGGWRKANLSFSPQKHSKGIFNQWGDICIVACIDGKLCTIWKDLPIKYPLKYKARTQILSFIINRDHPHLDLTGKHNENSHEGCLLKDHGQERGHHFHYMIIH